MSGCSDVWMYGSFDGGVVEENEGVCMEGDVVKEMRSAWRMGMWTKRIVDVEKCE